MMEDEQYPRGRMNEEDQGALRLSLITQEGKVILYFGKPISWSGSEVVILPR